MKKLTAQQIKEIKLLRLFGFSTYKIAKRFGVSQSTALYHTSKSRRNKMSYKMNQEYQNKYHRERYNTDEVFKNKHKQLVKESKRKNTKVGELNGINN